MKAIFDQGVVSHLGWQPLPKITKWLFKQTMSNLNMVSAILDGNHVCVNKTKPKTLNKKTCHQHTSYVMQQHFHLHVPVVRHIENNATSTQIFYTFSFC